MYDKNYYNEYVWEYVLPNHLDNSNENNFTEELTYYKPTYSPCAFQLISSEYVLQAITSIEKEYINYFKYLHYTLPDSDYIR